MSLKRTLLKSWLIPLDILDKEFSSFSLEEWEARTSGVWSYMLPLWTFLEGLWCWLWRKIPSMTILCSQEIGSYQGQVQTKARGAYCALYVLHCANSSKYMRMPLKRARPQDSLFTKIPLGIFCNTPKFFHLLAEAPPAISTCHSRDTITKYYNDIKMQICCFANNFRVWDFRMSFHEMAHLLPVGYYFLTQMILGEKSVSFIF